MSSPHEDEENEKTVPEARVERDSQSEEEEREETDSEEEESEERDPEEDLISFLIGLGIILVFGLYKYICGGIYISPGTSSLMSSDTS